MNDNHDYEFVEDKGPQAWRTFMDYLCFIFLLFVLTPVFILILPIQKGRLCVKLYRGLRKVVFRNQHHQQSILLGQSAEVVEREIEVKKSLRREKGNLANPKSL